MAQAKLCQMKKGKEFLQSDDTWGPKGTAATMSSSAFEKKRKLLGLRPSDVAAIDAPKKAGKPKAKATAKA